MFILFRIFFKNFFKNLFLIFIFSIFTPLTYAAHPEIWGYDLSNYPAIKNNTGGLSAYKMDDGDIWFVINIENKPNKKYLLLEFFKNKKTILTQAQRDALYPKTKGRQLLIEPQTVKFSDGTTLKRAYNPAPKHCSTPDFVLDYLVQTKPTGKTKKISILGTYPNIKTIENQTACDFVSAPYFYQKLYLLGDLIDLKDETFIATSENGNLIVRFKKDLTTPFEPHFVIDYAMITALKNKLITQPKPLYQAIHSHLLVYWKQHHGQ